MSALVPIAILDKLTSYGELATFRVLWRSRQPLTPTQIERASCGDVTRRTVSTSLRELLRNGLVEEVTLEGVRSYYQPVRHAHKVGKDFPLPSDNNPGNHYPDSPPEPGNDYPESGKTLPTLSDGNGKSFPTLPNREKASQIKCEVISHIPELPIHVEHAGAGGDQSPLFSSPKVLPKELEKTPNDDKEHASIASVEPVAKKARKPRAAKTPFDPATLAPDVYGIWCEIVQLRWQLDSVPAKHALEAAAVAGWLVDARGATAERFIDWVRWWWHDPDSLGFRQKTRPWPSNVRNTWDTAFLPPRPEVDFNEAMGRSNGNGFKTRSERNLENLRGISDAFGLSQAEGHGTDRLEGIHLLGAGHPDRD